jgi:catechol 2,3-dioxygenase-like lactoylglutathione lyase family enzyme
MNAQRPTFLAVDHVSWTVPDLNAAIAFYTETFGAKVMYQIGPIDSADIPKDEQGRDWMETHVGVKGAKLTLAMLQLAPNLKFQLVQYDKPDDRRQTVPRAWLQQRGCKVFESIAMDSGPLAGKTNIYVSDPWGHTLELVD